MILLQMTEVYIYFHLRECLKCFWLKNIHNLNVSTFTYSLIHASNNLHSWYLFLFILFTYSLVPVVFICNHQGCILMYVNGINQFNSLVQGCSNSIANTLEVQECCTKPLIMFCSTVDISITRQYVEDYAYLRANVNSWLIRLDIKFINGELS